MTFVSYGCQARACETATCAECRYCRTCGRTEAYCKASMLRCCDVCRGH